MAITKTTKVERVEVFPAEDSSAADTTNAGNPSVECVYLDTVDDSTDDDLPASFTRTKILHRYTNEDDQTATDVSSEDQIIQDICGALWS